jgi:hypothetical protein
MTERLIHGFKNIDHAMGATVHANTWANERYPQMFGPKTLMTGDIFLSQLLGSRISAQEFMSYKLSVEIAAHQLAVANKAHAAYGQYELGQMHITYTWEKDRYDTLNALKPFIPKSYTGREKSSIAYIDNPKNSPLFRRVSNLFSAGALVLKEVEPLERAQLYRETLRDFQKRKHDKKYEWTNGEKEELNRKWKTFSDFLCDLLTTAISESNNGLEKPFNKMTMSRFIEEIARQGTRVVATTKHSWF